MINEETLSFEIQEDGEIIKHTVKDQKQPTPSTPHQPEQPQKTEQLKVTDKPVTPQQIITKPQLRKTSGKVEKLEGNLPTTGGKAENPHLKWIGFAFIVLVSIGFVFAIRNRKKAE